jgi:Integrase core domain
MEAIAALRRLRFTGPEIAECLDMPLSTVSGILTRIGMGKLGRLGLEPAVRYERQRPGELIHIDIKRLGRIQRGAGCRFTGPAARSLRPTRKDPLGVRRQTAGWECVHIAVDDCTRLAYAEVLTDQSRRTVIGFLRRAVAFYHRPRHHRAAGPDRQRRRLPLHDPRRRLPHPKDPPSAHPRLPTPNQRQSRTIHPHPPRWLGLRRDLPLKHRTHRRP